MLNVNDIKAYVHICIHMHTHAEIYMYIVQYSYMFTIHT